MATIRSRLFLISNIDIFRTLYVNFKSLPFSQAKYLPVIVGKNVRFRKLGIIKINGSVFPGMISLGYRRISAIEHSKEPLIIFNEGVIEFNGKIKIHPGVKLWLYPTGCVVFGGLNTVGARTVIVSKKKIEIGRNTGCSWDCGIFDTDFHYLKDVISDRYLNNTKSIFVGNDVFIGNHVNISKGTKLPNGSVVSSWSNVFGSYLRKGENLLIAGNPAKLVGSGYTMTHGFETNKENEIMLKMKG